MHSLVLKRSRRLRVEVAGLFGDEARARRIEARLAALPGVKSASASARTGRALIELADGDGSASEAARAALGAEADPEGAEAPSARRLLRRTAEVSRGAARAVRAAVRSELRSSGEHQAAEDEGEPATTYHDRSIEEVAAELGVDPTAGLDEPAVEERVRVHGRNVLAGIEPRGALAIAFGQVLTVPNAILASAAGASALLGDMVEAVAIGGVVGVNVAVGYFTEARAEELLHAWGELRVGSARVRRAGRELTIAAADVVPGDVLLLRAGDAVAADARVIAARDLTADESTLTGESEPSEKSAAPVGKEEPVADRSSLVFVGTVIASGDGEALVVATGERTELGAIRRALSSASRRAAPLEQQLDVLGKRLALLSLGAAAAIVPIGLLRGQHAQDVARGAVALGVAAIPEGVPTAGTTALALASKKLFQRGIVIRRLAAAETLGAVSVVCADKTGTLTQNRMRVEEIVLPGGSAIEVAWMPSGGVELRRAGGDRVEPASVRDLTRVLALNADVEIGDDGAVKRGSGTERALVELAIAAGFPVAGARRRARRVGEERRSAERSFMVTMHDDPELGRIELVKGAPEQVLSLSNLRGDGKHVMSANESMASRGLRVLACAWRRKLTHDGQPYIFLGLVGLRDPPRPGVDTAIASLARAGVRTYMLTGDQERTAKAIAASLGIDEDAVRSRVTPDAKVDVVRDLEERGHVVAMTGDGVNDGPALEAADVGIAMGQRGTDIARAVADVVLARDDLPAIAEAVAEGRRLYDNVRRAIDYLVATNMSEVLVMLLGSFGRESPLTPLELLWLNMMTDVVPALALAVEPAEPGVMERPPRDPRAPLLGAGSWRTLGRSASEMAGATLGAYALGAGLRSRGVAPSAMAFSALVTAQLLHTGACRASGGGDNPTLRRALAGSFALQVGALALRPLRAALGVRNTPAAYLALAAAIGALPSATRWARAHEIVVEPARAERGQEAIEPEGSRSRGRVS